jgi:hypothetical protein
MAVPVSEQIALVVKARLDLITTGAGYETTAAEVIRPTRISDRSPKDFQIVIAQGDQTPNEELSRPGNPPLVAWDFPFEIRGILRPSETDTTAIDTYKNRFEADVRKAIATPLVGNWRSMEGLAINSSITGAEQYASSDGSEGGFKVTVTVMYRHPDNDPYTVSG